MKHLNETMGPDSTNWKYSNLHVNEYTAQPWSFTPLRSLFHREVPTGGNGNTINVSGYSMSRILHS